MEFIEVHNVNSKLEDIEKNITKIEFNLCSCTTCINRAEVRGNVQEVGNDKKGANYIVDLCKECSSKLDNYNINIRDLEINKKF